MDAELVDSRTLISLDLTAGVRKRAKLNGMNLPRASDLIGRLPAVCVSSKDLPVIAGEPADRRLFLDFELSQLYPGYLRHLTLYRRALDQRNALLRASESYARPAELFEPWEEQMVDHGAGLRTHRAEFTSAIESRAATIHSHLGAGEALTVAFVPKDPPDHFAQSLADGRGRDIARGTTSVGPHRDDIAVSVGGKEARNYGSQGQQRTAMIALKLATVELGVEILGSPPVLLLDDVFSDLDAGRRERLVEWIQFHAGQTLLTCTEASSAGPDILASAKVFRCVNGELFEDGMPV